MRESESQALEHLLKTAGTARLLLLLPALNPNPPSEGPPGAVAKGLPGTAEKHEVQHRRFGHN